MRQSILLVTVDSLRADRVGVTTPSHKPDRNLTPNLDSLGQSGTTCTEAYATGPGTRLSFPGILTSSPPLSYGGYNYLSEDRPSLPRRLQQAGYRTTAIQSNAQLLPEFGYGRGFDEFVDLQDSTSAFDPSDRTGSEADTEDVTNDRSFTELLRDRIGARVVKYPQLYRFLKDFETVVNGFSRPYATATETRKRAVSLLKQHDGPVFLWVHFMDPHVPYFPPERFRQEVMDESPSDLKVADLWYKLNGYPDRITSAELSTLEGLYDATVRYFDHEIGLLVDRLEAIGHGDAALVVASDHGDEFRDHGGVTHSSQLYDELTHVPLLFNGLLTDDRIEAPVSLMDIPPTVSGAVGGDCEGYWGSDLAADPPDEERRVFSEISHADDDPREAIKLENRIIACRTGRWTYIEDHLREQTELYDRDDDPTEHRNLVEKYPGVQDELAEAIDDHWEAIRETSPELLDRTMSDDIENRLQDLGYL